MVRNAEEIRLVISEIKTLPTLPSVMGKVLEVLRNERSSAGDLEKVIKFDKSLTLKILGFSNAAIYGFPRKITTISDALVVLGFDLVKVLALSLPVFDLHEGDPRVEVFLKRLWSHSCKTALLTSALSKDLGRGDSDTAFLSGLLADIGRAAFIHIKGKEYIEALDGAREGGRRVIEVEREIFGVDHAAASGWIADDFLLPEDIVSALSQHHNPTIHPQGGDISNLVYLADYMLSLNEQNQSVDGFMCDSHAEVLKDLGLEFKKLPDYMTMVMAKNSTAPGGVPEAVKV